MAIANAQSPTVDRRAMAQESCSNVPYGTADQDADMTHLLGLEFEGLENAALEMTDRIRTFRNTFIASKWIAFRRLKAE